MRKNPPFGAKGFDFAALRTGMGSRHEPTIKGVKLIRVKIGTIPCEWVLAQGADPDPRLLHLNGKGHSFSCGGPVACCRRERRNGLPRRAVGPVC
jgi:hypothetical protein